MKNKTKEPYEIIDELIGKFDFKSVHELFKTNGWTWYTTSDRLDGIPSIDDLKNHAYHLFDVLLEDDKLGCVASGRMAAYKFDYGFKLVFEPFTSKNY